jgi:hypothetical protein
MCSLSTDYLFPGSVVINKAIEIFIERRTKENDSNAAHMAETML